MTERVLQHGDITIVNFPEQSPAEWLRFILLNRKILDIQYQQFSKYHQTCVQKYTYLSS